MAKLGLLIDYEWCSGCQSCELACKNEHGYGMHTWGMKLMEFGPYTMIEGSDKVEWNYVPFPTSFCDMCEERIARGETPACALHCLCGVIEWGTPEELAKKMEAKGSKCMIYLPTNQDIEVPADGAHTTYVPAVNAPTTAKALAAQTPAALPVAAPEAKPAAAQAISFEQPSAATQAAAAAQPAAAQTDAAAQPAATTVRRPVVPPRRRNL